MGEFDEAIAAEALVLAHSATYWRERALKAESALASRPEIEQEAARYRFLRDQADSAQIAAFVARRRTRLAADRVCDSGIEIAAVLIEGEPK